MEIAGADGALRSGGGGGGGAGGAGARGLADVGATPLTTDTVNGGGRRRKTSSEELEVELGGDVSPDALKDAVQQETVAALFLAPPNTMPKDLDDIMSDAHEKASLLSEQLSPGRFRAVLSRFPALRGPARRRGAARCEYAR